MAKPIGPRCNMRCGYCYYIGKTDSLPRHPGRMDLAAVEGYIAQRFAASREQSVHFEWHGGEPTLMGLDFYRQVARAQRRLCPPGRSFTNGLQTNGLLLNDAWADFLAGEGFSVGLSLDGPADLHDRYRRTPDGGPTHARVMRSWEVLRRHGVFTNLLCVLHEANAGRPDEVYGFFRSSGAAYLQFLPLVTPAADGRPNPAAAAPEAVGDFLCRVFDLWLASDVGRIVVQTFDEALRPICGLPHALCIHSETCGRAVVLERDGGVYACDHYVDEEHRIGSLGERSLADLAADPRLGNFGRAKRDLLPDACRSCEVLAFCNGGCPKDRLEPSPGGGGRINHLCPAYKKVFLHCRAGLERVAAHLASGAPLRDFN